MNVEINAHNDTTKQYIEIEIGPVEITARWPRIATNKVVGKIEQIEETLREAREEIEQ